MRSLRSLATSRAALLVVVLQDQEYNYVHS